MSSEAGDTHTASPFRPSLTALSRRVHQPVVGTSFPGEDGTGVDGPQLGFVLLSVMLEVKRRAKHTLHH